MDHSLEDEGITKLNLAGDSKPCADGLGILDLDDFSLCCIITQLNFKDYSAFSKTCKRINSIASDRYSWRSSVLFRRISYLIQTAWFEGLFEANAVNYKKYPKCALSQLMREGVYLGQTLAMLNMQTLKHVWDANGPFATKLLSSLVAYKVDQIHNEPIEDWLIECKNFHFSFESSTQILIQVSVLMSENRAIDIEDGYVEDASEESSSGSGDDDVGWAPIARKEDEYIEKLIALTSKKFKIKAYVDEKCILIYKSDNYEEPYTRKNRDTEDVPIETDLHSFKKITDALVKCLPETNLPVRSEYLLDLFLHFPNKPEFLNVPQLKFVNENENAGYKDTALSEKIIMHRKAAIEAYHQSAEKFVKDEMKKKELCEELVLHLGTLLDKKPSLYASIDKCYHASAKVGLELMLANDDAIRSLLRRVDFQSSTCDFSEQDLRNCVIKMRLCEGQVLRIEFTWEKDMNIGMTDTTLLKYDFYIDDIFFHFWETDVFKPSPDSLSKVNKITLLLRKCVKADLGLGSADDLIKDKITVTFLIAIVKGILKGMKNCSL